jgi:undecaprenyl-diphosphatase
MNILSAILLGIVEGVTEFLPVSSTGHLIIVRKILGENTYGSLSFDAILQLATTLALVIYFRKDLLNIALSVYKAIFKKQIDENFRLSIFIIVGTLPVLFFGFIFEDKLDILRSSQIVALFLIIGSILMYFAEKYNQRQNNLTSGLGYKKSFLIGLFQSLALFPGMSRSGSTISGGLFSGLSREVSVRFSFLLSVPILFATGLKKLLELNSIPNKSELLTASFFAFIFAILSIHFLLKFLKNHRMYPFVVYRVILALVILGLYFV